MIIELSGDLRRKIKRFAWAMVWVIAGGGLVAVVFAVSFILAMRVELQSTRVEVPDLFGLSMETASLKVAPLQLVLEVVEQRNDPRVASGRVIEQMPPAGAAVRQGRKVKLVMSLGGRVLRVPDLVGHASRAVAIELRQEGFVPGDEARVYSYGVPTGRVIAQVPPADTTTVPDSRVHRLVSDGSPPAAWVMPDLTGVSRQRAERWIERSGFRTGTARHVTARGVPEGTVVGQTPLAGYPIRSRDIVELTIAE